MSKLNVYLKELNVGMFNQKKYSRKFQVDLGEKKSVNLHKDVFVLSLYIRLKVESKLDLKVDDLWLILMGLKVFLTI